jgi:uridine kinase
VISQQRETVLRVLADAIVRIQRSHPTRVAIDGVDGAGKTTLADELVPFLERFGRTVIRASIDGFHRPRAERYLRGPDSPVGFYHDSFDTSAVRTQLLDPLGPGGDLHYRARTFDWRTDLPVVANVSMAPPDAILIFDGIFSQRAELEKAWDLCVFLEAAFDETLERSLVRDRTETSVTEEMIRRFWARYAAGQNIYLEEVCPREKAHFVIDNNDPNRPLFLTPNVSGDASVGFNAMYTATGRSQVYAESIRAAAKSLPN